MAHLRSTLVSTRRALLPAVRSIHTTRRQPRADTLSRIWARKMEAKERYRDWTKESLLSRIAELEAQTTSLRAAQAKVDTEAHVARTSASTATSAVGATGRKAKPPKQPKAFDFASAPCRKIALRFSYDGAGYSGLAAQNTPAGAGSGSTLPTVEGVLWDALCTTRLVDPSLGMEGAGFSRCGRTDRGVSAAGQVVALWVRSKKVNHWSERMQQQEEYSSSATLAKPSEEEWQALQEKRNAKLEDTELPYVSILNRILPPTIRIQAWSPVRTAFSARFDCVYRHYKYFFPAGPPRHFFPPTTTSGADSAGVGGQDAAATRLDIGRMRDAARRLLGEHDFRNLCKVDASKQITNYRRRIDGVSIDRVSSHWASSSRAVEDGDEQEEGEHMYVLNLRGTAFLYHQVRNIMAILFLVGARLEHPSVVEELMNTERGGIAADRIKMRLAAQQHEDGQGVKWWLPVNATSSTPASVPEGVPMWIHTALSSTASEFADSDAQLEVYATKPNYEMAADRPLVLWECGFLPTDVEWRVGTYDGPLDSIAPDQQAENASTASSSLLRMHKIWTQHAISTELSRHFVLASPAPSRGTVGSRTLFEESSFPYLARTGEEEKEAVDGVEGRGRVIPLGNGTGRGAANYVPLKQRQREDTYEEKNRRWAESTGKRRADKRAGLQVQADEAVADAE